MFYLVKKSLLVLLFIIFVLELMMKIFLFMKNLDEKSPWFLVIYFFVDLIACSVLNFLSFYYFWNLVLKEMLFLFFNNLLSCFIKINIYDFLACMSFC